MAMNVYLPEHPALRELWRELRESICNHHSNGRCDGDVVVGPVDLLSPRQSLRLKCRRCGSSWQILLEEP